MLDYLYRSYVGHAADCINRGDVWNALIAISGGIRTLNDLDFWRRRCV